LMDRALGKDGWLNHQREAWAWMENRFIPYPVQNNIRYLERETVWKILEGLIKEYESPNQNKPLNFAQWINRTFGEGFAEVFMNPYNFKVWAFPPDRLSYHWIGERVAVTDLKRIVKNVLFALDDLSWGPNNTFQFPKKGGTGQIWRNVADLVGMKNIVFNSAVKEINTKDKVVTILNNEQYHYETLLNTTPLDKFCKILSPALPKIILDQSQSLLHSSSNIIGFGIQGKVPDSLKTKCWIYYPENTCPFYRATIFSNYSPNNVPDPKTQWSLMTEISESSAKPVDQNKLIEETLQGCINVGLLKSKEEVISTWKYRADYGYPTPSLNRDEILKSVQPYLEKLNIYSRGRFGAWKYEVSNQDHSLMQGVEWADRVVNQTPEVTLKL
jgi:protoporphyrinogen oxidase